MMVDYSFIRCVALYMLPRPRLRKGPFDDDRVESVEELGIILGGFYAC